MSCNQACGDDGFATGGVQQNDEALGEPGDRRHVLPARRYVEAGLRDAACMVDKLAHWRVLPQWWVAD